MISLFLFESFSQRSKVLLHKLRILHPVRRQKACTDAAKAPGGAAHDALVLYYASYHRCPGVEPDTGMGHAKHLGVVKTIQPRLVSSSLPAAANFRHPSVFHPYF